jgi:hypothetical protein
MMARIMIRSARWVPLIVLVLGASPAGAARDANVAFSIDGRIGSLQLDRSTARAVIAFAGRPDAVHWSRFDSRFAGYIALGYDCRRKDVGWRFGLTYKGPYCTTVFFVNRRTGRFADFETSSRNYVGPRGVRVGTRSAVAERLLHQRLRSACGENLGFTTRRALLTLEFVGGSVGPARHVVGAHLADIVLTSPRHDVGLYASLC